MALVVAAAIIADGRLLAARRDRGTYQGFWEFPGGKVEPGESDEQALTRELREELGISVSIGEQIGGAWSLAQGHTMHVYRVDLPPNQEPQPLDGHDQLRWLAGQEIDSVAWIPWDLPIVATVTKMMHN